MKDDVRITLFLLLGIAIGYVLARPTVQIEEDPCPSLYEGSYQTW